MGDSYIKQNDLIIFDDKHYLLCGDSTNDKSFSFLKEQATMTLTSPPYNVGKNNCDPRGKFKKYLTKGADTKSDFEYLDLMSNVLEKCLIKSRYVFWNIAHTSGNKISLIDFNYKYKEKYVDTIIWAKTVNLPAIEPNVLNSDFEYIYIYIQTLKTMANI